MFDNLTLPKIYPEISIIKTGDKNLVLIAVKPSSQKPHTANGRPFKRVGKNIKSMSQSEYGTLLLEKNKDKMQFDAFECKGAKLTDIDKNKIKEFLIRAKRERRIEMNVNMGAREVLTK